MMRHQPARAAMQRICHTRTARAQLRSHRSFVAAAAAPDSDRHRALSRDIKHLGSTLGSMLEPATLRHVEFMRKSAQAWRNEHDDEYFGHMTNSVKNMSEEELRDVARAFSHFLALSNCAETHHRLRRLNKRRNSGALPLPEMHNSVTGATSPAALAFH